MKRRLRCDLETAILRMWVVVIIVCVPLSAVNTWLVWQGRLDEKQLLLVNLILSWLALFTGAAAGAAAIVGARRAKEGP